MGVACETKAAAVFVLQMDTDSDATVAEFSETEGHQSDDEVTSSPSLLDTAKKPLIQEQTKCVL